MGYELETSKFLSLSLFCNVSKNTLFDVAKIHYFPVKIDSNARILFVMILYSWFCLEECIVKCNFVSIILQGGKLNQHMKAINRIKVVLAEKQLSGKWLANEIGCTENTVSRWCSNKVQPSLENLLEIAEVLKVDIRELLRSSKEQV